MIAKTPQLILATTCSDRKAGIAKRRLHLRAIDRALSGRERARRWAALLKRAGGGRESADRLYQGDHWTASRKALDAAKEAGFRADLWVVSAGYGLYPAAAPVAAYAATFTPGHADSVAPDKLDRQERLSYLAAWWHGVATHVPVPDAPARTFADLAVSSRQARIVVVSGGSYLDAITEDLLEAAAELASPDQLIVISGGASTKTSHPLEHHLLPVDARFQSLVGGARSALNARTAHWLLGEIADASSFGLAYCQEKVERLAFTLPEAPRYDRQPMTDAEVLRWIRKHQGRFDRPSATAMLRVLRDSGHACEQKRFGTLFKDVMGPRSRR